MKRVILTTILVSLSVGCGTCGDNNGTSNNGTNGETNGSTNGETNGSTNGGTNGSTNGGTNGSTNGGTNGSTNGETNNGRTEVPADELTQAFHEMLCETSWECLNKATAEFSLVIYGRYASLAECKAAAPSPRIVDGMGLREIAASAQDGRIDYDAMGMADCLNAIEAQMCDPVAPTLFTDSLPAVCEDALAGTVAVDGDCVHDLDCEGDLTCERSGMNCYGTCQPPSPDCGMQLCTEDEYCGPMNTCLTRKAAGEACGQDDECEAGTTCNGELAMPVCVEAGSIAQGEVCDNASACEKGTICSGNVCEPLEFRSMDEDCGPIPSGGIALCEPGLVCLASGIPMGTCLPPIEEGGMCDAITQCSGGLACIADVCLPPLADGEMCASPEVCASENCNQANECERPDVCMLP